MRSRQFALSCRRCALTLVRYGDLGAGRPGFGCPRCDEQDVPGFEVEVRWGWGPGRDGESLAEVARSWMGTMSYRAVENPTEAMRILSRPWFDERATRDRLVELLRFTDFFLTMRAHIYVTFEAKEADVKFHPADIGQGEAEPSGFAAWTLVWGPAPGTLHADEMRAIDLWDHWNDYREGLRLEESAVRERLASLVPFSPILESWATAHGSLRPAYGLWRVGYSASLAPDYGRAWDIVESAIERSDARIARRTARQARVEGR